MVYQPKLGNMVAGNAQFQTIVKSFALEHLARVALSDDGDECGLSLVQSVRTMSAQKKTIFSVLSTVRKLNVVVATPECGERRRSPAGLLQFYRADQRHGNAKSR